MTSKTNKDKTKTKSHSQDSIPSFIRKTYDILEERKFPDIIDWNPEGTALVIKKPSEFCSKVLPAYFKHNNLTSFVRQLNMYNFHKRRTQNIDHVYYHELFQKGKKQLLKDIKRKNHEHALEKAQKAAENQENAKNGKDCASLAYENQFLKRLYNDAMQKISMLESQVRDMTQQHQTLWTQACQQNGENKAENLQDQPLLIPPLKLEAEGQAPMHSIWPFVHNTSLTGQNGCFAKLKDESGDSTATELSHNSPNLHQTGENEKLYDLSDIKTLQVIPQLSQLQAQKYANELMITKKETSIGQLFGSWDDNTNTEVLYFADQKLDKSFAKFQAGSQDTLLLKKRQLDLEHINREAKPYGVEPRMKRHELCIFNRRGLMSTGTEERDLMGISLARESIGNEEYESVDLMDFNQPFCS